MLRWLKRLFEPPRVVVPPSRPKPVEVEVTVETLRPPARRRKPASEIATEVLRRGPLVFDTETTGLDSEAQIIEISVLSHTGDVLLDTLIRPSVSIHPQARKVHGISAADVAEAPTIVGIMPQLQELFDGKPVLSYNFDFDRRMLSQTLEAHGIAWPEPWAHMMKSRIRYCVMRLYAQYRDERNQGNTRQRLDKAMAQCGIVWEGEAHRGLADTRAALAILRYMADNP